MNLKKIIGMVSCLVILAGGVGVIIGFDARYAKAIEVQRVEQRQNQHILSDRIDRLQERIWKLEDRYRGKEMDPFSLEEYRRLIQDKQKSEKELQGIKIK